MSRGAALVAAVLAVVVALGVGLVWKPWVTGVPDGAALVVGDQVVTEEELQDRNESLRALYGIQAPSDGAELAEFRKQSAKSMAISIVLDRAVEDHGIEVSDAQVEKALENFLESGFDGDRDAFVQALGSVGTSEEKVLAEIRRQLELQALLDAVVDDVEVTGAELRAAFAERRQALATPEQREVSNIVLRTRGEAVRVRRDLEAGGDIGTLARRHSIDASTRDRGGALGTVSSAELLPAVGKAVFSTAPGGVYGPVRGSQGWNVGRVARVVDAEPARLARVKKDLRAALEAERTFEQWARWLEGRLRGADLEYADRYRPDEPFEVTSWAELPPTGPEGRAAS